MQKKTHDHDHYNNTRPSAYQIIMQKNTRLWHSAEDTNSQSHKQPMTITIHSAGVSSQSSKYAKYTTQRPLTYITKKKKKKTTQVDHSTICLSSKWCL